MKTRFEHFMYTFNHKRYYLRIEKQLLGKNTLRGYLHDIEKLPFYLLLGKKNTSKLHKKWARHHNPKSWDDYVESVIDYECARYTKEDKQLNARDFIIANKTGEKLGIYDRVLDYLGL